MSSLSRISLSPQFAERTSHSPLVSCRTSWLIQRIWRHGLTPLWNSLASQSLCILMLLSLARSSAACFTFLFAESERGFISREWSLSYCVLVALCLVGSTSQKPNSQKINPKTNPQKSVEALKFLLYHFLFTYYWRDTLIFFQLIFHQLQIFKHQLIG